MKEKFRQHIKENFADILQKRVLVAISGGLDSVVLSFLLKEIGIEIVLAHCNFGLRDQESDEDEIFVTNFAEKNQILLKKIKFDTQNEAKKSKKNIQLTARELRYEWFDKILKENSCDFLATAHHLNDNIETFFINLSRGTGISGLLAIPEQNKYIIRPLLPFSRQEILSFALENGISWREDSSNLSEKYIRNKIRHKISPILEEIHPEFFKNFQKTQKILQNTFLFIENHIDIYKKEVFSFKNNCILFNFEKIKENPSCDFILFEILKEFNFNFEEILKFKTAHQSKEIFSKTHKIKKDRSFWVISEVFSEKKEEIFVVNQENNQNLPFDIHFEIISFEIFSEEMKKADKNTIFVDFDKISFPFYLRKAKKNDVFYPFGMNGKKTLSKFFNDEKYSLTEKTSQWILTNSDEKILWIVQKRADNRFKISGKTNKILKIYCL